MINRIELEKREKENLAPYAMLSSKTQGRKYPEDPHPYRTAFQRDRDRIIHSTAFRRLQYKTQVFVNHEGDYFRTRLTHTLEVVQIARSIARILRVNEDLVEAVALAHDLGHTPFGHSGERTLDKLMKEEGGFEHNLQSLRVVDYLEKVYRKFNGLNLTYEVRRCIAGHSRRYAEIGTKEFDSYPGHLIEGQIVDVADSIAYDNHDIDDGLKSGILLWKDLKKIKLWKKALKSTGIKEHNSNYREVIIYIINLFVTDLIKATYEKIKKLKIKNVEDVYRCEEPIVCFSDEIEKEKRELEEYLMENFYRHHRICILMYKAERFIEDLFLEYCRHPQELPPSYRRRAQQEGIKRVVCDYIAGMTDRYAQQEYKKLFYPFEIV